MNHVLSIGQFDRDTIEKLFERARHFKKIVEKQGSSDELKGQVSVNLFYEPSTRTSSSFAAAMYRLSGNVISINDVNYSSVSKGETLEDTVRTLEQYTDVIVLRHPEVGAAKRAAAVANVPILNAGDGIGEHPTQALLDLFTIYEEQGHVDGLTITMLGDLKNGRTVHSLAQLLKMYDVELHAVAPKQLVFPSEYASVTNHEALNEIIDTTDILYATRVQRERFDSLEEYEKVQGSYIIDEAVANHMKKSASIMHPLPRVGEIAFEVDKDPRAAYFRQMQNGMFVRMALLEYAVLQ